MQLAASLTVALALVAAFVAGSHVAYDDAAADYVPLDKWLRQRDTQSCLASSPTDILFVVDGSESVGLADFHLAVKSALVDTVSKLRLGPNLVQVGVLVFSDQVSQTIAVGRFKDKLQLLAAVSNLAYVGSYTSLEAGIEGSMSELQRRREELNRTTTPQVAEQRKTIVVFVTDGWATHGSSLRLREMAAQLGSEVTAVLALGLEKSSSETLRLLATDPTLVFNPTTYPEFLAALFNLLNPRCSDTCRKFDQQREEVHRIIMTLAQYTNTLVDNFASYKRQEQKLLQYIRRVNASAAAAEADIGRTCEQSDESTLQKIVDLRKKIDKTVNGSEFGGLTVDIFISKLMEKMSSMQQETYELRRKLTVEKSRREGLLLEEERFVADFEAQLRSQTVAREANEAKLKALEERVATYTQELLKVELAANNSANVSQQLASRLQGQEKLYSDRLAEMRRLAEMHATLQSVSGNGSVRFERLERQVAVCESYLREGETILFAVRCGSGASFAELFSRDDATFSTAAFAGLSASLPMYKSSSLRRMHTMGYFSEATLEFFVGGRLAASLTMDTSRFELANVFTNARVTASYPWAAAYVNSVYSSSRQPFRLQHADDDFLLIFGDTTLFEATGSCADLVGVYVVLQRPHRCFPDAAAFPAVYISESPFGGRLRTSVDELRLVTRQPPAEEKPLPTVTTTQEQFSEVLLYVRSGAGYLQPLLLSPSYTAASVLADIDDVSQLSQHYKSSLLAKASLRNYEAIRVELYDRSDARVALLEFRGPFEHSHELHGDAGEAGSTHEQWDWFRADRLHRAEPFDLRLLRSATFRFYDGKEFFSVGTDMAAQCERRRYFLTIVDSQSPCACFKEAASPSVFFANSNRPQSCSLLQRARSLQVIGFLRQVVG